MTSRPNVYGVSREIWKDPDFADEPFTEREAWLWLVGAAAWKQIKTRGNSGSVTLQRGEFSFALTFLATKFKWNKSKVERFLKRLENRDTIRDASRDGSKVYFIKNYNRFNVVGVEKSDAVRDDKRDATETTARRDRDKEETGETREAGKVVSEPKGSGGKATGELFEKPKPANTPTKAKPKSKADEVRALLYARGKEILGGSAGGVITNLLKAYDNNAAKALAKLEDAAEHRDPAGWLHGYLHAHGPPGIEVGMLEVP